MPNNHLAHASGTQTHWGTSEQNCKEMRKTTVAAIWPSLVILTEYEPLTSKNVFSQDKCKEIVGTAHFAANKTKIWP